MSSDRILIVDDEPEIVEYLKAVLATSNFNCVGVLSPVEALKLVQVEQFVAILSDMKMPEMTGLEMIMKIKAIPLNAKTPIIVLSGALDDDVMIRLDKLGIIDIMSKPPEIDILVRLIEKASRHVTKPTGNKYLEEISTAFGQAFTLVCRSHLASRISVTHPVVNDKPLTNIEYCGMVTMVGRRACGVLTISYQNGFTEEFAKVMLGGVISGDQLSIFETSAGEIAEQVALQAIGYMSQKLGLYMTCLAPVVVHGHHAALPIPNDQPRVMSVAELNGKSCYMEFALMDLAEVFKGRADAAEAKILQ